MRSVAKSILAGFIVVGLIGLLAACAPKASTVYTRVTDAKLKAGDEIPVPSGDPVLTVTGNIGTTNVDDSIQMDMDTIESVGLVDYSMTDPFDKVDMTWEGVLMSDLLDLWGVPDDATTLHMVALNDYAVDVPISDMRTYPVIFAIKQNGEYMPVADRGPAMLVYPYKDFQFDQEKYNDFWIWQIKSIEVQ